MNEPRVLLVEDDPNDVLFMKRAWRAAGFSTPLLVREDGERAAEYLSGPEPRPDAVLLDLKLPRFSGLELLAWIRSRPGLRDLTVYALTSSREPQDMRRAAELGVRDYLTKPTSYAELLELAKRVGAALMAEQKMTLDSGTSARYQEGG